MESIYVIGSLFVGALLGALTMWLLDRPRHAIADTKLAESVTRAAALNEEVARLRVVELREAQLQATLQAQQNTLDQAQQTFREVLGRLSHEALHANSEAFLSLAGSSLAPFRDALTRVQGKLDAIELERQNSYSALMQSATTMVEGQRDLQKETANLVKALRQPQVRGRWGEIQLRRVIELAGMLDHCDFVEQQSFEAEDGRLRPDIVVNLPGGKTIVVDAKAPLVAYLESIEAPDDSTRAEQLALHAAQVRHHMQLLSNKAYWDQFDGSPEFVVMFLPGEAFFGAALQADPSLIEFGVEQRVLPASPITLIALLRASAYGWQQEKIAEDARAISDLGRELYERICKMTDHFDHVGDHLGKAVEAYNDAVGSLENRVLVSARRFQQLGAAPQEALTELEPIESAIRLVQAPDLRSAGGSDTHPDGAATSDSHRRQ